ncbi:MAG: 4-(cytidine 5'-diphospho)-2-C-methyl-D-erythritol kinase [Deltaproteobacteria bacterium]|nr:4-(cytidine 5'-diphospho)-2-C-methyl-D-erythritol kinase [Deltaproteobacteria bacterium]
MKIRAPAKINLSLRVVGKRADGYHLLDTIMLPVSLFDEIEIKKRAAKDGRPQIRLSCAPRTVPEDESNLAFKAARLILAQSGAPGALDIHITKRIPVGAGLGGGSTDAAATLVGINRLFKLGFSQRRLEKLGTRLGADVAFFINAKPARARGIGDRLTPINKVPCLWLVIVYPKFAVSTAWVYGNLDVKKLTKSASKISIRTLLGNTNGINELLVNDLEAVTIGRHPKIESLKRKLTQAGASGTLMSGSGSSVFGIFNSRQKATKAFDRLRRESGLEAFLVRTLD